MNDSVLNCPTYELKINVLNLGKVCKYHKLAFQEFDNEQSSTGLCPNLHNLIYPYALALLYGSPQNVSLSCMLNPEIQVQIKKRRKWGALKFVLFFIILKITKLLGVPWDCELYDYFYSIKGHQSCKYHPSDLERKFNADDTSSLCPASLYTIFPAITAGEKVAHCVDHEGISYNLKE